MEINKIYNLDCLEGMKKMEDNSVDAIITDPPYGLEFMGKEWDKGVPGKVFWIEMLRVLKPGGFLLSFGGTRTYHRMACGIEDAGFEIRDCIMWLYGSGFPKSLNIGKQIDKKMKGDLVRKKIIYFRENRNLTIKQLAEKIDLPDANKSLWDWEKDGHNPSEKSWKKIKEVLEVTNKEEIEFERKVIGNYKQTIVGFNDRKGKGGKVDITAPATPEAKEWEGWGTALKPAYEPIVVARKPISEGTVAQNVLKHGTGGINIDACRIGIQEGDKTGFRPNCYDENYSEDSNVNFGVNKNISQQNQLGRFPANIILDEEAAKMLDEQSGNLKSGDNCIRQEEGFFFEHGGLGKKGDIQTTYGDSGGASRFFYCAKTSQSERNKGVNNKNIHPTVKPVKLMEYLIKLVSKEDALILDPFMGSGTTAIACHKLRRRFIGFEKKEEYYKIAMARVKEWTRQRSLFEDYK